MNNGRFSNGFLLGLVIGGGAVFLLGTKTGKKLLKEFSENGIEGINELLEEVEVGEYEDEKEVETTPSHQEEESQIAEDKPEEKKTEKKRFFKRPPK